MNTKYYTIINFSVDFQVNQTQLKLAVFLDSVKKLEYDKAIENRFKAQARIYELVQKGETVLKTEKEKYEEVFSDEFRDYLQKNQLNPIELNKTVQEKYDAVNQVKSGRTAEENAELNNLELSVNAPLPAYESKIVHINDLLDCGEIVTKLEKYID